MARILAIDYGFKRTGLAVTDPLQIVPGPLDTVPTHTLLDYLAHYLATEPVETIVVGHPTQTNGQDSETMKQIRPLVQKLRALYPNISVVLHDERYTSVLAQRAIRAGGLGRKKRADKALVDRVSATIILQSYLTTVH